MKANRLLKTLALPLFTGLSLIVLACDKNDDDERYSISGDASGNQEVPAVISTGAATLNGTYDADNNRLIYTISWNGLSGNTTAAHFHGPAPAGANAGPIHDLTVTANGTSGTATGTIDIADSTETHLLAGKLYYNLHTGLNPSGEIRGQVFAVRE